MLRSCCGHPAENDPAGNISMHGLLGGAWGNLFLGFLLKVYLQDLNCVPNPNLAHQGLSTRHQQCSRTKCNGPLADSRSSQRCW